MTSDFDPAAFDDFEAEAWDRPGMARRYDGFLAQITDRLIDELRLSGLSARQLPGVDAIIALIAERARRGDVILIMSNGSFGGIHQRLLTTLGARALAGTEGTRGHPTKMG